MTKRIMSALLCVGVAVSSSYADVAKKNSDLPKVLIIGDSISIAYTPPAREMLKEVAIVEHHTGNAQHTGTGLKKLNQWIGTTKWDVIHFNWGLWDLCYRHPDSADPGKRDKVNGTVTTTLDQYQKNLDELVNRLRKTGAKLIWAHTTVVPQGEPGRIAGDARNYNAVATRVMRKHGVTVNDLNALTGRFTSDLFVKPGDVHYTTDGYWRIAAQVAERIREVLKDERADSGSQ